MRGKQKPRKARLKRAEPGARKNLAEFLRESPLRRSGLKVELPRGFIRRVEF